MALHWFFVDIPKACVQNSGRSLAPIINDAPMRQGLAQRNGQHTLCPCESSAHAMQPAVNLHCTANKALTHIHRNSYMDDCVTRCCRCHTGALNSTGRSHSRPCQVGAQ